MVIRTPLELLDAATSQQAGMADIRTLCQSIGFSSFATDGYFDEWISIYGSTDKEPEETMVTYLTYALPEKAEETRPFIQICSELRLNTAQVEQFIAAYPDGFASSTLEGVFRAYVSTYSPIRGDVAECPYRRKFDLDNVVHAIVLTAPYSTSGRTGDANLEYIKLLGHCWQSSSVDELVIEPGYEYWYHGSTSINIHRIQTEGVQLSTPNPQSFGTVPSFYLTNSRSFAISRAMQKMTQSSTRSEGGAIIRLKIPQGHWETLQPHLILTQTSGAPNGLELLTTEQACNGDYQWTVDWESTVALPLSECGECLCWCFRDTSIHNQVL